MARIKEVDPVVKEKYGLQPGDELLAIDDKPVKDYIDFLFYTAEDEFNMTVRKKDSARIEVIHYVIEDIDPGITLEGIVFDKFRTCGNRCIFCFIDQGGPVKRSSLKVKDDDYRFSFLQGSFISLTNLTEDDLQRIKTLKISPLYVSVHATDPQVRSRMMGNPGAGEIILLLKDFVASDINMHTQIVVCPGYNDGEEFERTLNDLYSLGRGILSIGVVPVGLTRYREGLAELEPVKEEKAQEILQTIENWQEKFKRDMGSRVVFAADELYALSGFSLPAAEEYEDYPQLENGIGLARLLREESEETLKRIPLKKEGHAGLITSKLGGWAWKPILEKLKERGILIKPLIAKNEFLGPRINVSGLLAAQDLWPFLDRKSSLPDLIFLPQVMFNENGKTLDGFSLMEIKERFSPVRLETASNLEEMLEKI